MIESLIEESTFDPYNIWQDQHFPPFSGLPQPEFPLVPSKTQVLAKKDTVLVASDGLFDNLHQQEIVDIIRSGPLSESAAQLSALARQRMIEPQPEDPSKPDDLSLLLFRLA